MLYWFFAGLFIVAQIGRQSHVLADDPTYVCYAWGDPHVQTWRLLGTPLQAGQQQNCYSSGSYNLVSNPYVHYSVQTLSRFMIQTTLSFFDPLSTIPFCTLQTENFQLVEDNVANCKCQTHGITWTNLGNTKKYVLTVNYENGNIHFKTTLQYAYSSSNSHFNIHIWQSQSLVNESTGLCTQNDPSCALSRTLNPVEHSPKQMIRFVQAHDICETYINGFLNKNQRKQRSIQLNNTADNIMNGCIEDVMFTGDVEIAQSGLSVLMMEELTDGETSFDSVKTAIDSGINEASMKVQDAAREAQMKVARFF